LFTQFAPDYVTAITAEPYDVGEEARAKQELREKLTSRNIELVNEDANNLLAWFDQSASSTPEAYDFDRTDKPSAVYVERLFNEDPALFDACEQAAMAVTPLNTELVALLSREDSTDDSMRDLAIEKTVKQLERDFLLHLVVKKLREEYGASDETLRALYA
jgi:hypothetical protein